MDEIIYLINTRKEFKEFINNQHEIAFNCSANCCMLTIFRCMETAIWKNWKNLSESILYTTRV